ncbi:MAG: hypothetical protein P4L70_12220 [Parasulfuritortus sp.]|nr:hypothetical protein [Parasulfuritortus sp.]
MMKLMRTIGAAVAIGMLLAALPGCAKKEGPAEQAGKAVDNAVEKTGNQVEKAGENIQDAAKGDKK